MYLIEATSANNTNTTGTTNNDIRVHFNSTDIILGNFFLKLKDGFV